jgi:hypothetical protein
MKNEDFFSRSSHNQHIIEIEDALHRIRKNMINEFLKLRSLLFVDDDVVSEGEKKKKFFGL